MKCTSEMSIMEIKQHWILTFALSLSSLEYILCSNKGPDFSDVRNWFSQDGQHASQGLYKEIYGGSGKRYGVHFPGKFMEYNYNL